MHRRSSSWRLLLSGWLLGASLILQKCYLCNMKGEMAVVKVKHIDTLDDLFNSPDYTEENFKDDIRKLFYPDQIQFLSKSKGIPFDGAAFHCKMGLIMLSGTLPFIRNDSPDCNNVYKGKEEFFQQTAHLIFRANLSFSIKEAIRYRTTTFVETRQGAPNDIKVSFETRMTEANSLIPLRPIKMSFLTPIFNFWFYGVALSVVAIALEIAQQKTTGEDATPSSQLSETKDKHNSETL